MATDGITKVCVSGYFNPLHVGHLNYLNAAAKLGWLVVIVNNDKQVKLKGSKPCMTAEDRAEIIRNLRSVNEVVVSIDDDKSVCKTLELVKPDIFANGGDRKSDNVPETDICRRLGIMMIYGVGGEKIRSSSELLR